MRALEVIVTADELWVDFGPWALYAAFPDSALEGIEVGPPVVDVGGEAVGWREPLWDEENTYPRVLPGYRLQELGEDPVLSPFGMRFVFMVERIEEAVDDAG